MAKLNIKKVALLFTLLLVGFSASAQSIKDIKINEVLYINENLTSDKYGWIELQNTGYSSINLGGCYLSIESKSIETEGYTVKENFTYRIPTTVPALTIIPPQGYFVIYAGGASSQGPNYSNFDLKEAKDIYLIDASGKLEIDSFIVEDESIITANVSLGREVMSYKEMLDREKADEPVVIVSYNAPTPNAVNLEIIKETASEDMQRKDPIGYGVAFIAMSVVFSVLLLLCMIFKNIGVANQRFEKRNEISNKPATASDGAPAKKDRHLEASGEVIAAISLALKQYRTDIDNLESNVLTINKVARTYSPWSSRIYGLTQVPNRK